MILTISGNNDEYVKLAAEKAKELLKDLKAEIKSIKDLPNYRPNRQLFGGGDDFDVWIITDCKTAEDLEPIKKGITIFIVDFQDENTNLHSVNITLLTIVKNIRKKE